MLSVESVWRGRIFSGRSPGVYSGSGPTHPSFGCLLGSLAILHELSLFPGCLLSFFVGPRPGLRGSPLTWDHPVHPTGIPVCHVTCHTHTLNPSQRVSNSNISRQGHDFILLLLLYTYAYSVVGKWDKINNWSYLHKLTSIIYRMYKCYSSVLITLLEISDSILPFQHRCNNCYL